MARPTRRTGNLAAEATSFVGRRRESSELRKKLTTARLVSLVGPGRATRAVPGEHVLPAPPLNLPAAHAAEPLNRLRQNGAVMLFTERAAEASGTFELSASTQAAVADVCRRLDALPLAIALAA